jgi:hypothetical protein
MALWDGSGIVRSNHEADYGQGGGLVVPKPLRDALGLGDGGEVEVSVYGAGLQIVPGGRTARIIEDDGQLVADSDTVITDEMIFGPMDSMRR